MPQMIDRLRLGASGDAIALADVKTEDLIASMSDEMKASLAAALVPEAPDASAKAAKKGKGDNPDPEKDPNEVEPDDDEDDKNMKAAAFAAGQKASSERVAAVAASEHFEGREKAAMKLLGSDKLLGASAEDVIGLLADMPKGSEATAEMLAALRGPNPNLGNEGGDTGASNASGDHGWGKAHARASALYGLKPAAAN